MAVERSFVRESHKPVFLHILALYNYGWRSGRRADLPHTPGGALTYNADDICKRPHYMLCLQQLGQLFDDGLKELAAYGSDSYYA